MQKTRVRPLTCCLGVSKQLFMLGHPWRWRRQPARKRRYNYKSTRNHVPEHHKLQNERYEGLKLRKYKIIFDDDTKDCSHQNYASKMGYLSPSRTGYRNFTRNYIFILHLSIRTENGARHVVTSAQACTFVLSYFYHSHRKNNDSREQSNHVAYRAPSLTNVVGCDVEIVLCTIRPATKLPSPLVLYKEALGMRFP